MASISVEETINAPIDRVFSLFTDFHHLSEHIDGIVRSEVLTDGPVGEGTRFRETRVMFGKEATEEMAVTRFEPEQGYRVEAESHGARYVSDFAFVAQGDTTRVKMDFQVLPQSLFAKLFSFLSGAMLKSVARVCEQDMRDLKRIAEA